MFSRSKNQRLKGKDLMSFDDYQYEVINDDVFNLNKEHEKSEKTDYNDSGSSYLENAEEQNFDKEEEKNQKLFQDEEIRNISRD